MFERRAGRIVLAAAPVCLMLCFALTAGATVLAKVRGIVHDPSHRPVPGAHIEIAAMTSQFRTELQSDAEGAFEINALPFGEYRLTSDRAGICS